MENHQHHHGNMEMAPNESNIIPVNDHTHQQHDGHDHGSMINDFKRRFYISLALTVPILLFSPMIQEMFHFKLQFPGQMYLLFALSSILFIYGGFPFLKGFITEITSKLPGMMTLIAIAISVAYLYSSATVFGLKGMDFFWELATLVDIMLLGHWIEMKSIAGASNALELLVKMIPSEAHLVEGESIKEIKLQDVQTGNILLVKPGEKIPADGRIIEGESYLNESFITGESKPVLKTINEKIIAGSLNGNGSIKIKVEQKGADTYLSKVIKLVQEAQNTKSKTQRLADKAAFWLTIFALSGGFITLTVWLLMGKDYAFAIERMVTVMVISCPHALGLAIPLVVAISTALAAKKGLLIRNRTAFEDARKITMVVFDKTGTLTKGEFAVNRFVSIISEFTNEQMLAIAAALEQNSEHPIASGIVKKAKDLALNIPIISYFKSITGKGIEAKMDEKRIMVVSPGYLKENKIQMPEKSRESVAETIVYLLSDNILVGFVSLADEIRPESYEAIKTLKANGIKTILLTGDNKEIAESVSRELGMDNFIAEVLPHQKLDKIKELQVQNEFVAMTGDGVNDAPALAQANVGIAIGSGTDVAAETSDIILVNSNPKDIVSLILFGKATYKKMIQNLLWATLYNLITLPLATGFISGIMITPAIGAVFMSLSTVIVAINAQSLKLNK